MSLPGTKRDNQKKPLCLDIYFHLFQNSKQIIIKTFSFEEITNDMFYNNKKVFEIYLSSLNI